jgi:hypothetical protein
VKYVYIKIYLKKLLINLFQNPVTLISALPVSECMPMTGPFPDPLILSAKYPENSAVLRISRASLQARASFSNSATKSS